MFIFCTACCWTVQGTLSACWWRRCSASWLHGHPFPPDSKHPPHSWSTWSGPRPESGDVKWLLCKSNLCTKKGKAYVAEQVDGCSSCSMILPFMYRCYMMLNCYIQVWDMVQAVPEGPTAQGRDQRANPFGWFHPLDMHPPLPELTRVQRLGHSFVRHDKTSWTWSGLKRLSNLNRRKVSVWHPRKGLEEALDFGHVWQHDQFLKIQCSISTPGTLVTAWRLSTMRSSISPNLCCNSTWLRMPQLKIQGTTSPLGFQRFALGWWRVPATWLLG